MRGASQVTPSVGVRRRHLPRKRGRHMRRFIRYGSAKPVGTYEGKVIGRASCSHHAIQRRNSDRMVGVKRVRL